jgi:hypothetical protein
MLRWRLTLSEYVTVIPNRGTKAGRLVARLVAYHGPACPRTPGAMAGEIWIAPDFDTHLLLWWLVR